MATIIDTLITKFEFKSDRKGLEEAEKGFVNFKSTVIRSIGAITAVLGGGAMFKNIVEKTNQLNDLASSVGMTAKQMQGLQFVAQSTGVPLGALESSVERLNVIVGQSARGQGMYAQVLAQYGVSIRNSNGGLLTTFQLLQKVNKQFANLSTAQQFDLAQNLGLSPQSLSMFQEAPKAFNEMIKVSERLSSLNKKTTDRFAELQSATALFKMEAFDTGVSIVSSFIPAIVKLEDWFSKLGGFVKDNSSFFEILGGIIGAVGVAMYGTAIATGVLDTALAILLSPIIGIIAGVTGLSLVIQDLWVGLNGGKSVLTGLGQSFLNWIEKIKIVREIINSLEDMIASFVDGLLKIPREIEKVYSKVKGFFGGGSKTVKHAVQYASPTSQYYTKPINGGSATFPSSQNVSQDKSQNITIGDIHITGSNTTNEDVANVITSHIKNERKIHADHVDSAIWR